jgi:hypothetical protein
MEGLPLRQIARDADIARTAAGKHKSSKCEGAKRFFRGRIVWTWVANWPSLIRNEAPIHPIN